METSDKKAIIIMALLALLSITVMCLPAPAGLSRAGQRVLAIAILAGLYPSQWELTAFGVEFKGLSLPMFGILCCIGVFNFTDAIKAFAGK